MALLGIVEGVLVCGAGNAERLGTDGGTGGLEGGHGRLLARRHVLTGTGELGVELLLATEQARAGHLDVDEDDLGRVAGADAVLLVLLTHREALGAGRDDEARLTLRLQFGVDAGDHDVDVGDATVGDPRFGAVDRPLVLGLVVDGAGAQARDVGAGVGLAYAERAELHLVGRAVALGHPLHDLLGRAVAGDPRRGEGGTNDRHADARIAPEQLLDRDRQRQPGRVARGVEQEVDAVQTDLGGFLDDGPRELLALVPLRGDRPDDTLGEVVDPLLDLELVFVEVEREVGHDHKLPIGNQDGYPSVTSIADGTL